MAEAQTKKKKKVETLYRIHNTSRAVTQRLSRAKMARRDRKNLLLGGGLLRIQRGRPQAVAESTVRQLLAELKQLAAHGTAMVTTMDGREVDLDTLKPLAPVAASAGPPKKPLDSAANDKTYEYGVGEGKPNLPGGKAAAQSVKKPEVLGQDIPEGEEDLEAIAKEVASIWNKGELVEMCAEYEVGDTSGTKADIAARLVEAGLRLEDNGD